MDAPRKANCSTILPAATSSGLVPSADVRRGDGSFIPEMLIDAWVRAGHATRAGALLTARDGQRFVLQDAVRVLGRRNGDTDPYGMTGRADALRELLRKGAIIADDTMRLGPAVYDIEHGVIALPVAGDLVA